MNGCRIRHRNSFGVDCVIFMEVFCRRCGEKGFFQLIGDGNEVLKIERAENPWAEMDRVLQKDWNDWHDYKIRHLKPTPVTGGSWSKPLNVFFLIMIVGGWSFFFIDQIHLLDGIFENIQIRMAHIQDYTARLGKLPCLSRAMKEKLKTVAILLLLVIFITHSIEKKNKIDTLKEENLLMYQPSLWHMR